MSNVENDQSPVSRAEGNDQLFAVELKKVLVLFAHPSLERSQVNRPLLEATRALDGVTVVDLYAEYPDFDIDVDREQSQLIAHDVIVFMHPFYWYSTPAILKEWQDLVLEHGFAYGTEGNALAGKIFFTVISAGGPEAAYCAQGYNHFTIRELLRPLEQTALLCKMDYLPPFTLFGSLNAVEEHRVEGHIKDWLRFISYLQQDRVNLPVARNSQRLNFALEKILTGELS